MPHGVLFRGGDEKNIRQGLIDDDELEAIISLPPNLFYGTGIPACIMVMRARKLGISGKPAERRGKILFINADAEYAQGRAQNFLRPEDIQKIASTFHRFTDVPRYARVVTRAELAQEDYNCNLRRYVDNSPPPEIHDVKAILFGGVPQRQIETHRELFSSHCFDPAGIFTRRAGSEKADDSADIYFDFNSSISERRDLRAAVESDRGVQEKEAFMRRTMLEWWEKYRIELQRLPVERHLMSVRNQLLSTFNHALTPLVMLDTWKIDGVIVSWWNENQYDIKGLAAQGFESLLDSWVETIESAMEPDEEDEEDEEDSSSRSDKFDPLSHKLVKPLVPEYLDELSIAEAKVAEIDAEKREFESRGGNGNDEADYENEEVAADYNYARELDNEVKALKRSIKPLEDRIKKLNGSARSQGSLAFMQKVGEDVADIEAEMVSLEMEIAPIRRRIDEIEAQLKPYKEIKERLAAARRELRKLREQFIERLKEARKRLSRAEGEELVLNLLRDALSVHLEKYIVAHRQQVIAMLEQYWDQYRMSLNNAKHISDKAMQKLERFTTELGFTVRDL
jgi:type I restriction enzyme M protein